MSERERDPNGADGDVELDSDARRAERERREQELAHATGDTDAAHEREQSSDDSERVELPESDE